MGLFGLLRKHYNEADYNEADYDDDDYDYEFDVYEELDYLEKKANDNDEPLFSRKEKKSTEGEFSKSNKKEIKKEAKKKRNAQEEKKHLTSEEVKYNELLNDIQAKEVNRVLKLEDTETPSQRLERVNIDSYDKDDVANYVKSQCEIMEESTRHIDNMLGQYSVVTEHFSDIELFVNAPDILRKQIAMEAERVDSFTVDRRIFKASESKLSNSAYRRMEMYENELPKDMEFIQKEETNYENIKRDMRMLEGEQLALRMEARSLKKKQIKIQSAAKATFVCLLIVFSIFIVAMLEMGDENSVSMFFTVTLLSAILVLGMFALLKTTHRNVLVTQVKLNKATNLLNKIKIKYVNSENILTYEYNKYKVKNSYELNRKYEAYIEMKQEQKKILEMTAKLSESEDRLVILLKKLGMSDTSVWLSQVRALYNKKEMVEIRHELLSQRQKLREQIEYNEQRINEAKKNIKRVTHRYPDFAKETLNILDSYERRNKAGK